jgi:outer membrane protein OmpA-like peptidoglycan-associated protein
MPRGHYTLQQPANLESLPNTPKVSMDRYEALLQLYQAQNAIGIARAARADQYAPNTFAKAEQLLAEAQGLDKVKGNSRLVVQSAREASQTAEDARAIAERRMQDEKVTRAQADVSTAQQAKAQADAEVIRAQNEAEAAKAQADAERSARERAEADAAAARDRAAQAEAAAAASSARAAVRTTHVAQGQADLAKNGVRMRLLEQLNGAESTRDTPRGLVVTVPDASFSGGELKGPSLERVARVGRILAVQPGLRVQVEGYTDSGNSEAVSEKRSRAVQGVLLGAGMPPNMVSARGLGDSRPLVSNATPSGRVENRRVEIVVSGDSIGSLPYWDHAYSLTSR